MARTVNMHEAKTHLSRLVDAVVDGEEIVIARNGRPAARLIGLAAPAKHRRPGYGAGRSQVWYAPGWDEPDPDLERTFTDWSREDPLGESGESP